jgi:hypothetical protein
MKMVSFVMLLLGFGGCAEMGEVFRHGQVNRTEQTMTAEELKQFLSKVHDTARIEVFVKDRGWVILAPAEIRAIVEPEKRLAKDDRRRLWP